jgi:hypothetical protein
MKLGIKFLTLSLIYTSQSLCSPPKTAFPTEKLRNLLSSVKSCSEKIIRTDESIQQAINCSKLFFDQSFNEYELRQMLNWFTMPVKMSQPMKCTDLNKKYAYKINTGKFDFVLCFSVDDGIYKRRKGFAFFKLNKSNTILISDIKIL